MLLYSLCHLWSKKKLWHDSIVGQGHLFKMADSERFRQQTHKFWILRQWDNLRIFLIKTPPPLPSYIFTFRSDDPDNLSVICFFFSETLFTGDIKDKERNSKSKIEKEKFLVSHLYLLWGALDLIYRVWWTKITLTPFREVLKKCFFGQPGSPSWTPPPAAPPLGHLFVISVSYLCWHI